MGASQVGQQKQSDGNAYVRTCHELIPQAHRRRLQYLSVLGQQTKMMSLQLPREIVA